MIRSCVSKSNQNPFIKILLESKTIHKKIYKANQKTLKKLKIILKEQIFLPYTNTL